MGRVRGKKEFILLGLFDNATQGTRNVQMYKKQEIYQAQGTRNVQSVKKKTKQPITFQFALIISIKGSFMYGYYRKLHFLYQ